jgi:hypothetical protein
MRRCRVIQCGTGVAGREALRAILADPALELAGLLVHSAQNDGVDAGTLAGLVPSGVTATRDLARLVAADADIVNWMMLVPDLDVFCAFLAAGKNVVTTAGLMYPAWKNPAARDRLASSCQAGGTSFYVTGINPGWVDEVLPLTLSALCREIDHVHIREYADCARYPSAALLRLMGFGRTEAALQADRSADMGVMREFFAQSVAALAHGLGLDLDEVREQRVCVTAPRPIELPSGTLPAGTVAGQRWLWEGLVGGRRRVVQETWWITAFDLAPGWPRAGDLDTDTQWQVTIEGEPSVRCTFEPQHSFARGVSGAAAGYNPSGLATAMAAVNSLVPVWQAPPGLLNAADLPQPRFRGRWRCCR